jgi:hypothetical protein
VVASTAGAAGASDGFDNAVEQLVFLIMVILFPQPM